MPTFDIISEVNLHELSNAIDQTNREIATRFDFKNADAQVEYTADKLQLRAETEFQIEQIVDILYKKLTKRGVDISSLESEQIEVQNRRASLAMKVKQGIETEIAKKIIKHIKDSKLKVQASIQSDQVRVTGKKRDDLQQIITLLRDINVGLPLQFTNFRD
jgi:hypothetical protein